MSRARSVLLALVSWLPLIAVFVLAGFAIGWWATILGLVVLAIVAVAAIRAMREVRNRPPADPATIRQELIEIDRRAVPWIKAWTFGMLSCTALGVVLLLLAAFATR